MRLRSLIITVVSVLAMGVVGVPAAHAADPTVTITSPANGTTGPNDVSVTGTTDADPSQYRVVLVVNGEDRYGTINSDGTWGLAYQQFDYGWNSLCAQIRNLDLNITYSSYCSAYRVLPETDLELLITWPYEGALVGPTVTVDGYVNHESTVRVWVDGNGPTVMQNVVGSFVYDGGFIVDGTYKVVMEATDAYGRVATATVSFTVDATAPATPVIKSPSTKKIITTPSFTVTGTAEPLSHVEIRDQYGSATGNTDVTAEGTWSYTFTDHELSPYYSGQRMPFTFQVVGYDDAGNVSDPLTRTYTVKIAP